MCFFALVSDWPVRMPPVLAPISCPRCRCLRRRCQPLTQQTDAEILPTARDSLADIMIILSIFDHKISHQHKIFVNLLFKIQLNHYRNQIDQHVYTSRTCSRMLGSLMFISNRFGVFFFNGFCWIVFVDRLWFVLLSLHGLLISIVVISYNTCGIGWSTINDQNDQRNKIRADLHQFRIDGVIDRMIELKSHKYQTVSMFFFSFFLFRLFAATGMC